MTGICFDKVLPKDEKENTAPDTCHFANNDYAILKCL